MSTIQTTNIKHNASASNNITLDSSGNVGIGVASPVDKLALYNSGAVYQRWQNATTGTGASDGYQLGIDSAGQAFVWQYENQPLVFATNNTERARIDSSGNVGIGTTSPAARLQSTVNTNNGTIGVAAILDAGTQNPTVSGGGIVMNFRTNSGTSFFGGVGGYTDGTNYVTGLWGGAAASGAPALFVNSAGNLAFNSGYGSTAVAYGCRAWVNFNGTGTVAIRASGNVSSITDLGTGDYTANFSTAMPDINYSQVWTAGVGAGVGLYLLPSIFFAPTVNGCSTRVTTDGATITDAAFVCLAVFR